MVMKKTTIYLSDELVIEIKSASRRERRPEAEIIREALGGYFKRQKRSLPSFVGMVSDGSFDASKDEEYLAEHWKPDW